jgi:HlyD family secretion protein
MRLPRVDLSRRGWQAALGVAVLLAGWAGWRALRGPVVPVVPVARQALAQRVVASGKVLAPARIQLAALGLSQVSRVAVEEGDHVAAGQLLVQLDDAEARANLSQARAAVALAAARVEQVADVSARLAGEALRQAELRLDQAGAKLRRTEQIAAAGSASEAELDDARKARDLAASQLASARAQARAAAVSGADQRVAAAALDQSRGAERAAETRLAQTRIVAPAGGVVVSRQVEPGDVVQAGKPLLVVARDGDTRITVQPDEKNLALLRVGQPATASADAFPDRAFPAVVDWIAPAVDPARGTVEVKLRVPSPPPFLLPDMTVSVNVETGREDGALVVPSDAVRDAGGEPYVLVLRDGRVARQPVKLGMRGVGFVQVVSGLAAGEPVVAPGAPPIQPGARARGRPVSG